MLNGHEAAYKYPIFFFSFHIHFFLLLAYLSGIYFFFFFAYLYAMTCNIFLYLSFNSFILSNNRPLIFEANLESFMVSSSVGNGNLKWIKVKNRSCSCGKGKKATIRVSETSKNSGRLFFTYDTCKIFK